MILPAAMLAAIASIALSGCSSRPIDELKMAGVARQQARNAEAPEYEPLEWDRAQTQWDEANALIHMSRYSEARAVLIDAVGSFNTARDKAERRVESLQIEIKALQSSTKTEMKNLEKAGEHAKANSSLKKRIDGALPLIEEKISTMNTAYNEREYLRARMAGQEAIDWMNEIEKDSGTRQ